MVSTQIKSIRKTISVNIFLFSLLLIPKRAMMMSKRCRHLLSLLFVFSLVNFPFITISETPCAYPCYPPPIGGGGSTQPAGYYPQPTAYYPPSTGYYHPPPTGNVPNYPSPPYEGGDYGGGYYGPPPPDPILPYFPFYYRKPPHQTDQSSSSASVKSTVKIVTMANMFAVLALLIDNV
ncbi:leucine-rich repeat extensin-like protein 1 [Raphanus sativus]|uniref:Leucine-rich repeat extensin-like protein 1 n=1 Tax=Raphanus sativus TaxID=3726 RepID=A0A6J0M9K6_RAPSA|nr:leucine-rich repeat extensin-like protein 1 [Raphanus sativus]